MKETRPSVFVVVLAVVTIFLTGCDSQVTDSNQETDRTSNPIQPAGFKSNKKPRQPRDVKSRNDHFRYDDFRSFKQDQCVKANFTNW